MKITNKNQIILLRVQGERRRGTGGIGTSKYIAHVKYKVEMLNPNIQT